MKKLTLLLILSIAPVLAFAQSDLTVNSGDQSTGQNLVTNGCVSLIPDSLDFGMQPVDFASAALPAVLQNNCTVRLTVTNVTSTGPSFTQTNNCTGAPLPSGQWCSILVVFDPNSVGQKSQNLTVTYLKDGNPNPMQISIPLSGDGIDDATFNPATCNFGSVQIGDEGSCVVTIQNQEPQRLTINRCQVSPYPPFSQGTACPTSLAKKGGNGDSVSITLDFQPSVIGPASGTFAVTTDSPQEQQSGNPYKVSLTGTGMRCLPPMCCNGSDAPTCPPAN